MAKEFGVWIPGDIAAVLPGIALRPSSRWQVFLAILTTWCRYGCKEARLSISDISKNTSLKERTVKAALADLITQGLVRRTGRYKRLVVVTDALVGVSKSSPVPFRTPTLPDETGGARELAPRRCTQACPSPISSYLLLNRKDATAVFTPKQAETITSVLTESGELLGGDPLSLQLPDRFAATLGLSSFTTYGTALQEIATRGTAQQAGKFVRAVLALQRDPRVQGVELQDT